MNKDHKFIKNITITASGGPFLYLDLNKFDSITPRQAIKHPKWEMGNKISVDSSNMMNKSLELIEAKNLFQLQPNQVEAVVHPQSIIHGILNYHDNSSYAFLSQPNMEIPISSLFFPDKDYRSNDHDLDLTKIAGESGFVKYKVFEEFCPFVLPQEGGKYKVMPAGNWFIFGAWK